MPFEPKVLGRTDLRMGRMGVAASYGVPAAAVERAFECAQPRPGEAPGTCCIFGTTPRIPGPSAISSCTCPRGTVPVPTASDCYRFVLTRSEVDVCMSGPANSEQMDAAIDALRLGPMTEEDCNGCGAWGSLPSCAPVGYRCAGGF